MSPGALWTDLASTAREILGAQPRLDPAVARRAPRSPSSATAAMIPVAGAITAGRGAESTAGRTGASHRLRTSTCSVRPGSRRCPSGSSPRSRAGRCSSSDDIALIADLAVADRPRDRSRGDADRPRRGAHARPTNRARSGPARPASGRCSRPTQTPILALDEQSQVTWATRQAGELFGCDDHRLVGMALGDLVAAAQGRDRRPTAGERPVFRSETTGRRVDGTHFPAEIARSTVRARRPPVPGRRHLGRDVAPRGRPDPRSVRRRPVARAPNAGHLDLRRDAGPACAAAQRLDPETRSELLVSVAAEAERLQRMIENLVAMARIERGADFGSTRPVLIDRIIPQLVERERSLWPEVSIELVANGPVQMVAADEEYLAQIMRNLLSNAAKYSGPGSTVTVEPRERRGRGARPRPRRRARHHARTTPSACSACTTGARSRRRSRRAPASACSSAASS